MNGLVELFAITFSLVALLVSVAALAMVIGMKLSTHTITWKPLEDLTKEEDKEAEIIAEEEDEELLAKALDLQKKKKKQEDPLDAVAETSNF